MKKDHADFITAQIVLAHAILDNIERDMRALIERVKKNEELLENVNEEETD